MTFTKKIKNQIRQLKDIIRINKNISKILINAGTKDNFSYITISNGKIFYGYPAEKFQKRLFFLFTKKIKQKLKNNKNCINLLYDLNFRYLNPPNDKEAFDMGKYYDVKKGDYVLEIGAYIGMYAIKMAELVGEAGKVIAIEAINQNFEILKKNIVDNNCKNIIPVQKAVWNKKDILSFYSNKKQDNSAIKGIVNTENKIDIESDTVDNILKDNNIERIDFIRIQVNGAEDKVLEGMKETLKQKPKLMITVAYSNSTIIEKMLQKMGYKTKTSKYAILAQ